MNQADTLKFGLEERWHLAFFNVFRKYPKIERVSIFGSRAKGTHKPFSDIDFSLYGHELNEMDAQKIEEELEDLNHPYFIDVLAFNSISNEQLKAEITKNEKLFYRA